MTSGPVNLNRFKKQKARAEKRARADQNAILFGRSKAEKQRIAKDAAREAAHLDGHKIISLSPDKPDE